MILSDYLFSSIQTAIQAGRIILNQYKSNLDIEYKKENYSPVTIADKLSNDYISSKLLETRLPILSEEGDIKSYYSRRKWKTFWLIDPLDGTKEFINKNGEFTINIALIKDKSPCLGVVYAPVSGKLFFAEENLGTYKIDSIRKVEEFQNAHKVNLYKSMPPKVFTVVTSRSHLNEETIKFVNNLKIKHGEINVNQYGSSLKICAIAEGTANCYPRLGPTMEWDTAAAHAIVTFSGKKIINFNSGRPLIYNKKNLINPHFVVT